LIISISVWYFYVLPKSFVLLTLKKKIIKNCIISKSKMIFKKNDNSKCQNDLIIMNKSGKLTQVNLLFKLANYL
jgi:hypothetical protein